MANTEQAVWKPYPEYPFLQANQFGEIRTVDRVITRSDGRKQFVKGRVLKQQLNKNGYMYVHFKVNGKQFNLCVHRVVATSHLPNPNNLPEVNHKDSNPKNNATSNLEWCTREYNIAYKEKYGKSAKDAAETLRKSVIAVNTETFEALCFESQHEAACQLSVDVGHINHVLKRKQNRAGGYWFCYADENAVEKTRAKFGDNIAEKVEKLMNEHRN